MPDAQKDFAAVRIARAWDEGPRLRALELELGASGLAARYTTPGQYVRARQPGGGKEVFLALASAPGAPAFELLIQRTAEGEAPRTADAIAALEAGEPLEISAPEGKGFPIEGERGRDILLFAGGSGISAIRSLVEWIALHRKAFGRAVLLFGARTVGDLAYRDLFERWSGHRIEVVPVLSRAHPERWQGRTGYVQGALPELSLDPARASAFVTGGKAFDAAVSESLRKLGITRIYRNF